MEHLRLAWRPELLVAPSTMIDVVRGYIKRGPARLYANGTVLTLKQEYDTDIDANEVFERLKFVPDFQTMPLKDGNFIVTTNPITFVVLMKEEIESQLTSLRANLAGALFPGEVFFAAKSQPPEHYEIGLVGRAKIFHDAFEQQLLARLPRQA